MRNCHYHVWNWVQHWEQKFAQDWILQIESTFNILFMYVIASLMYYMQPL